MKIIMYFNVKDIIYNNKKFVLSIGRSHNHLTSTYENIKFFKFYVTLNFQSATTFCPFGPNESDLLKRYHKFIELYYGFGPVP